MLWRLRHFWVEAELKGFVLFKYFKISVGASRCFQKRVLSDLQLSQYKCHNNKHITYTGQIQQRFQIRLMTNQ